MTQAFRSIPNLPTLAALLLIGTPLFVAVLARARRSRGTSASVARTTSWRDGLLAAVALGFLWVLLYPSTGLAGHHYFDAHPFRTLWDEITDPAGFEDALIQVGGNILEFALLGSLAPLRWPRLDTFGRLLLAAAVAAAVVEGLQYAIGGRIASLGDWMLNVAGAMLGYGALRVWRRIQRTSLPSSVGEA